VIDDHGEVHFFGFENFVGRAAFNREIARRKFL